MSLQSLYGPTTTNNSYSNSTEKLSYPTVSHFVFLLFKKIMSTFFILIFYATVHFNKGFFFFFVQLISSTFYIYIYIQY